MPYVTENLRFPHVFLHKRIKKPWKIIRKVPDHGTLCRLCAEKVYGQ